MSPTPFPAPQASRVSLKQHAYDMLRRQLIGGQFRPGDALTVRGVAEKLNLGVMPVRAALERLQAEGAFVPRASSGTMVVPDLTVAGYRELRAIRLLLEPEAAARTAVADLSQAEYDVIDAHVEAMKAAAEAADLDAYLTANGRFHFAIYSDSGMPTLVGLIEQLWLRIGAYVRWMMPDAASLRASIANHDAAARAMRARDDEAARQAIAADILDSSEHLLLVLKEREGGRRSALVQAGAVL